MLRRVMRVIQDWWFRAAAALLAGMIVGLVVGEATSSGRSLPWTILLIAVSAAASAWVLRIIAGSRRRRDDRNEGLRRLRQLGERLAIYDRETGLYAYWYFGLRLEEEIARSERYGQTFSLVLLEAQTGRLAPDDENALFRHMSDEFRHSDLVAYLGNLRFIVLLANTDDQGASVVKEHLTSLGEIGNLTVGLASYPDDGETSEALLAAIGASAEDLAVVAPDASSTAA